MEGGFVFRNRLDESDERGRQYGDAIEIAAHIGERATQFVRYLRCRQFVSHFRYVSFVKSQSVDKDNS